MYCGQWGFWTDLITLMDLMLSFEGTFMEALSHRHDWLSQRPLVIKLYLQPLPLFPTPEVGWRAAEHSNLITGLNPWKPNPILRLPKNFLKSLR